MLGLEHTELALLLQDLGHLCYGSPGSKATPSLLDEGSGSGGIVGQSRERKSTHTLTSLASICQTLPSYQIIYCQAGSAVHLCYKSGPCLRSFTSYCTWSGFSEHSSNRLKFCRGRPAGLAFLSSQEGQGTSLLVLSG